MDLLVALEVVGSVGLTSYVLLENLHAGLLMRFVVMDAVVGPAEDPFVIGCWTNYVLHGHLHR